MNQWRENNYYEILSVSCHCSQDDLRKAYRALVKKNHPDLVQDASDKKTREEYLKILNLAYETLNDPAKRAMYDQKLESHRPYTQPQRSAPGQTYSSYQRRVRETRREPPEVLIRGNEHLLRVEYIRRRFQLNHDIGFYIRNRIVSFYTTPEGFIYVPITELERAQAYDVRGKDSAKRPAPKANLPKAPRCCQKAPR